VALGVNVQPVVVLVQLSTYLAKVANGENERGPVVDQCFCIACTEFLAF
jgi:hypothetical protein